METYQLSSKLMEKAGEYLIRTINDVAHERISTSVYVDGVLINSWATHYSPDASEEDLLDLVKKTHELKKTELEKLLELYNQVVQQGHPGSMLQLGVALHYRGFQAEAANLLSGVCVLQQDNHKALSFLGRTRLLQGRVKDAIELSAAAVELQPAFPDYQFHLGEALLADNQCEEAIEAYEQAIAVNLYYGDAYFSLGLAHLLDLLLNKERRADLEKAKTAAKHLNKSALIDNEYRTNSLTEGLQHLSEGRLRQTFDLLHQLSIEKRHRARTRSAAINMKPTLFPDLLSVDILNERISYLTDQLRENPGYIDLRKELAQCEIHLARLWWGKASEDYRMAYEMNTVSTSSRLAMEETESFYEDMAVTVKLITEKS